MVGVQDRVEIWDKDLWEERSEVSEEESGCDRRSYGINRNPYLISYERKKKRLKTGWRKRWHFNTLQYYYMKP